MGVGVDACECVHGSVWMCVPASGRVQCQRLPGEACVKDRVAQGSSGFAARLFSCFHSGRNVVSGVLGDPAYFDNFHPLMGGDQEFERPVVNRKRACW